jgi:hypothetical protein
MSLITLAEAAAWGEKTKLAPALVVLDTELLGQVEAEVLGNLAAVADTSTWTTSLTTPSLVKTIIAKLYLAWIIDRQYSEDQELSAYAALLRASALSLQAGIVNSTIDIPGAIATGDGLPSSYPTDTTLDRYGQPYGPYFTMDATF